jgi:hypothetical protein
MNAMANGIPWLTIITLLPVVGAAIALFSGRHARGVAQITGALAFVLSLAIWLRLPWDGSIGLQELHTNWVPSLGIQYHLGVDGLGALMLVLSALVTLMSVDAAHRVHHEPGLFFALVLLLEAGLFGSFTALNFFHWFLFWELSLIPAFFLIKLWGGPKRGPAATQFFVYTMAGSVALLLSFLGVFYSTGSMEFGHLAAMAADGTLAQQVTAHLGSAAGGHVMMWLAVGVLAGFAVKVPMAPFHTWLPAAYAEDRRDVEDGRVWFVADCAAAVWSADRRDQDTTFGAGGDHGGDGRVGGGGAEGFEARARLLFGESPGLLPVGDFCDCGTGWCECVCRRKPGGGAEWRDSADVQSWSDGGGAVLVYRDDSVQKRWTAGN